MSSGSCGSWLLQWKHHYQVNKKQYEAFEEAPIFWNIIPNRLSWIWKRNITIQGWTFRGIWIHRKLKMTNKSSSFILLFYSFTWCACSIIQSLYTICMFDKNEKQISRPPMSSSENCWDLTLNWLSPFILIQKPPSPDQGK